MNITSYYKAISILLVAFFTYSKTSKGQSLETLTNDEKLDSICVCSLIFYERDMTYSDEKNCEKVMKDYIAGTELSSEDVMAEIQPCYLSGIYQLFKKEFDVIYNYDSIDFSYAKRKRITLAHNTLDDNYLGNSIDNVISYIYNKQINNKYLWSLLLDHDELSDSLQQKSKNISQGFTLVYNDANIVFKNPKMKDGTPSVSKVLINGKLVEPGYLNATTLDLTLDNYGLKEGDEFVIEITYNALFPPKFFSTNNQIK